MNTEIGDGGFHERLVELIGSEEPFAWAKRVGIPSATFNRVWKERTVPKAQHLRRIAEAEGVSLDWLIGGAEYMPDEGLRRRLRECAKIAGSGDELARRTGIPRRTLESYLSGRSEPKATTAWHIARSCGISADWLISGEGPMRSGDSTTPPVDVDHDSRPSAALVNEHVPANLAVHMPSPTDGRLLGRLVRGILKIYEETGARIGADQAAELAALHHDAIAAITDDEGQRELLAGIALDKVRRDLLNPSGAPAPGKRRA